MQFIQDVTLQSVLQITNYLGRIQLKPSSVIIQHIHCFNLRVRRELCNQLNKHINL